MSTQKDVDYYLNNPDAQLTDDDATRLLLGGAIEGDTEAEDEVKTLPEDEESGKAPVAAKEDEQKEVTTDTAKTEDEPVVQAKDGKNTIPYSELEKARADAKHWEQVAHENEELAKRLQEAKEKDAETGSTQAQEDVLASIREDYPALADAMEKAIDAKVNAKLGEFSQTLKPTLEVTEDTLRERHFAAITEAHADFEDLLDSGKLADFVKAQPAFLRPELERVMEKGTAQEIIDMLGMYKEKNPVTPPPADTTPKPSKEDLAKAAEAAIQKAKSEKSAVPNSLSDVPAGGVPASEELGSLDTLSDVGLLNAMMSMTPDKVNEKLARLL